LKDLLGGYGDYLKCEGQSCSCQSWTVRTTDFFLSAVAYGLTETSGIISHMMKGSEKHESVGRPFPNTEMKVVHPETRSSLTARQTGEICVRGPQVRDRERFVSSCFPYLGLVLLFHVTTLVATSFRLTHHIKVALSADRPCVW
jgi:hypothetical protein